MVIIKFKVKANVMVMILGTQISFTENVVQVIVEVKVGHSPRHLR